MNTNAGLFNCRDTFLARATEKLGTYPSDFLSTYTHINASGKNNAKRQAAGVLLPLLFRKTSSGNQSEGQFVFQLIKRSSHVSQPGDLSCPGGIIHPIIDRLIRPLLIYSPCPTIRGSARAYASKREPAVRRIMTLFLANALRESWEEIGLSPFRVRLLGPLPTHSLNRFRRTIFPLAGFVETPGPIKLNREVDKIVEIPLGSFNKNNLIGCYTLSAPDPTDHNVTQYFQAPCLIHTDCDGRKEILWGATFHILIQFLEIVLDYHLPDWQKGPVVHRALDSDYLIEKSTSKRFFSDKT